MSSDIFSSELAAYENVLLAKGEIPQGKIPLAMLGNASQIVCCDGAVENLIKLGFEPTAIVGDCDSISGELLQRFKNRIHPDKDIEYNDLNKALRYYNSLGVSKIALLGGFGLREDHALANVGIMMMFAKDKAMDLVMVTNYGVFTPIFNSTSFNSYPGQQISVFSFSEDTELTFSGLKYPVVRRKFKHLWEGSLNEALSDNFSVQFEKGTVLVYRAF
jgi:thiamine pyrophosphokinase